MHPRYAWLLIAGFGAAYAALARFAFDGFPYSGDEYSMVLQAEAFARGVLHTAAPAHAELLRVDHVVIDEIVRSKYPPGASALLALGVRAGVPWLVSPVLGVVTLALAWWTARRELGVPAAWVTLLVLGLSPLFVFHASTFFSHPATTMWLALAFTATSEWTRGGQKRDGWLLLLGLSLGCAFITRPLDAVLFGAALFCLRSPRLVALSVVGAAPLVVVHLWYQARQFGSAFTDGYHAYESTFRELYGDAAVHPVSVSNLFSAEEQYLHVDLVRAFVVDWTVAGSAVLALLGAYALDKGHAARTMRNVSVSIAVVLLVALLPMVADPDDGARPRYLSTMLLSVAFLAGPGWFAARDFLVTRVGARMTRAIAIGALVFAPVQVGAFLMLRLPLQWAREGLYKAVARADLRDAVVVVRAEHPTRYARNGAFFDGPVVYVSAPPTMGLDAVRADFPGREIYEATEGREWTLVRSPPAKYY